MNWKPYTYLLKCPNGLFYYGVKYANNKRDLANPDTFWKDYFTSCTKIDELRKIYDDSEFSFEIRKTFNDEISAIKWESKVNRRLTTKSNKFINNSWIDGRIQSGKHNGMFGKKHKLASIKKMVNTRRENNNGSYGGEIRDTSYLTNEYRKKLSENAKKQAAEGRIYKVVDEVHLFTEFENFIFPANESAYSTKGSKASKISYFVNSYYIPKYKHLIKSKSPSATLRKRLRTKYGTQ